MKSLLLPIPFAAITILAWGSYGNWLHAAKADVNDLRMRQLFCVGLAYFILAIVIPTLFIKLKGEKGAFTISGVIWSLAAGVCGALGALGIIMALSAGGSKAPFYVMPLVFGCAPVVNTLVSMTMNRNLKEANSAFLAGIVLVAVGAALVFINKPKAEAHQIPAGQEQTSETTAKPETEKKITKVVKQAAINWLTVVGGILLTALSWGTYGSVLHKGQALMKGSRLRPLICVGLAYFVVAVIVPIVLIRANPLDGMGSAGLLAFLAGTAGAIGAFGIILSFTFGGKPIYIMPLVFGGAPIVNTLVASYGNYDQIGVFFIMSLTVVIIGAVMVLVCQPKPARKAPVPEPLPPPAPAPTTGSTLDSGASARHPSDENDDESGEAAS
ncbi:MAG: hypothetical protein ABGX05_20085 [Pirellulaceae bacterium]